MTVPQTSATAVAGEPWPEPRRPVPRARPSTEYWDVQTASWKCGAPAPGLVPAPRDGGNRTDR
jgi:hypothetical protein